VLRMITLAILAIAPAVLVCPVATLGQVSSNREGTKSEAAVELRAFLEQDWKRWMEEYPELATAVGYPGQNRRWTDDSPAGVAEREKHLHQSLEGLKKINRAALPTSEQLNFDLYEELLETAIEGLKYGDDPMPFRGVVPGNRWIPVDQMGSPARVADLFAIMPHEKVSDYEDILARMQTLHTPLEQTIWWMQEGLKRGYSPPKITLRDVPKQIADVTPADPMKSALLQPFLKFPPGIGAADRERLTERAKQIYTSSMAPAFQKIYDYLVNTYIPACRESIAASALPDGAAAYAYHIRWETTVNLTPQRIHEIGLAEVKRIRGEMDKVIQSAGFKGSFHEFTEFLRTDPRFYYDKPEDLVNGYRIIAKKIDPELALEFGKLPRLPYGVKPVPDYDAPSQTTGYYEPGSPEAHRPGYFNVNTYKLEARPKWEMEALSLHESVPGHHLQFALAQEQENERLNIELEVKQKMVRSAELEADAQKAREVTAAEARAQIVVLEAKAQADAMQHTLPLKEKQIQQSRLEAEARKESTVKNAEALAEAKVIDSKAELEKRRLMSDSDEYHIRRVANADAERMRLEATVLKENPLLIQKIIAEKLSDKVQIMMVPNDGKFFFANDVLKGMQTVSTTPH